MTLVDLELLSEEAKCCVEVEAGLPGSYALGVCRLDLLLCLSLPHSSQARAMEWGQC